VTYISGDGGKGFFMAIEMTIKGLMIDPITNMPIVVLRDTEGKRILPIWVGVFENAIALQIENIQTPRPMTHDLLRNIISDLEANVERIIVCDLRDNTFFAAIILNVRGESKSIDARPSDAIALALRTSSPIYVEESVIEGAKSAEASKDTDEMGRLRRWLENLSDEDLGKYKM
jgi:bifunctional DNase/RNase